LVAGIGLVLLVVVAVIAVVWVARRERRLTPEQRYQRDLRGVRLATFQLSKPRSYTSQGWTNESWAVGGGCC
jgi:hypothetical protein